MSAKTAVLVAHDDPTIFKTLKQILESASTELEVFDSGDISDTIGALSSRPYDLLIVDYYRPNCPGKKLLNALEELAENELPKSILAIADLIDRDFLDVEIEDLNYIRKDFTPKELTLAAANILKITPKVKTLDSGFILPFVKAAKEVLKIMCQTESDKDKILFTHQNEISDITATVPIVSPHFYGSLSISFEKACFLGVVGRMFGEEQKEMTADLLDAASEICNQILGQAKSTLNEAGFEIEMAIPKVVTGKVNSAVSGGQIFSVKFKTDLGHFVVETVLK